jgi:site-specific DNA-methyltransferase (adenine-specific)
MDCLEGMKLLPNECIDLTVTSPPYDNLRDYNNEVTWNFEKFKEIAKELFRITKPGGVVVWVVGDATINGSETGTSFRQALYFKEIGFNLHDTMIYHKINPIPIKQNRYYPCFEYMFILSKGKPKTFNPIMRKSLSAGTKVRAKQRTGIGNNFKEPTGKNPTKEYSMEYNLWSYKVGYIGQSATDKIAYKHPAIFPEQLANDHIISWSNEGDLVLDPFIGSGTTAKMAVLNDRKYIGFEISKEYFDIACQRLDDVEYPNGRKEALAPGHCGAGEG